MCHPIDGIKAYPLCSSEKFCFAGEDCKRGQCVGTPTVQVPVTLDDEFPLGTTGAAGGGLGGNTGIVSTGAASGAIAINVDFWSTSSDCGTSSLLGGAVNPDSTHDTQSGDCITVASPLGKTIYGKISCTDGSSTSSWTVDLFVHQGCTGSHTTITGHSGQCGDNSLSSAKVFCDNSSTAGNSSGSSVTLGFATLLAVVAAAVFRML